jgi:DNA-binding PadR family transcriptional regulator
MRYIDHDVESFGRGRGGRSGRRGRGPLRQPPHGTGPGRPGWEGHGDRHGFEGPGSHPGAEGRPPREGRGRRGGRGRGRALRGDVRTAILLVVADEAMHGYQIMQAMSERTGGAWRPSPGAVYPTIAQLEDEGLVTTREEGGRKLVSLTDEGRAYVAERTQRLGDPFAEFGQGPAGTGLHEPIRELHGAVRQVAATGTPEQIEAAMKVLAKARRSLYLILAGEAAADE